MTRIFATAMVAVGLSVLAPRLADAEVPEVKLALQNGSNYLPLMVMQARSWWRSIWPPRVWPARR